MHCNGNIYYNIVNNEVVITDCDDNANGTIIIPETIDEYKVTSISHQAFYGNKFSNIIIPNTINSIGTEAFKGCQNLKEITLPDSLNSIGQEAFSWCENLNSIDISIQNNCFSSLDGVLYDKDKTAIIRYPQNKSDSKFTLPNTVLEIMPAAFSYSYNLKEINLSKNLKIIGDSAFYSCGLSSIIIPDSVEQIGENTFRNCNSLKSVKLSKDLKSIASGLCMDCGSLISVEFGDKVKLIGNSAFRNCKSIKTISIPTGATKIYYGAFDGCTNLIQLFIPKSIETIENYAFSNCIHLSEIYYSGNENQWSEISIGSYGNDLTNVNIHYNIDYSNFLNINLGDYIQMGTYYGQPILWRCVSFEKISGYDANGSPIIDSTDTRTTYMDGYLPLMLSDKILCLKAFDAAGNNTSGSHGRGYFHRTQGYFRQQHGSNYWSDSNIRCWLNSTASPGNVVWSCGNPPDEAHVADGYNEYDSESGFLTNFTPSERSTMKTVAQKSLLDGYEYSNSSNIKNSDYHRYSQAIKDVVQNYDTAFSEQVTDTVFFPDVKQINSFYNNGNILGYDYYIGKPTAECVSHSEYISSELNTTKNWSYYLRSSYCDGYFSYYVREINPDGFVDCWGPFDGNCGIRPAFFLDSTAKFVSGAGTAENPYTVTDKAEINDNKISYRSDLLSNATIELNYSDSYFLGEKGYTYNLDLARASLALELSAFTPKEGDSNANIKKAYEYIGTDWETYVNYDKSLMNGEDKAAYSLATKTLSDGSTLIMVVLRGGGYGAEWRSNFHIGSGDFHNGFKTPADDVYATLTALISNANIDTETAKIWITGYSRGAAIANLVSGMINNNRLIKPENLYSYLFAVPSGVKVDNQNAKAPVHSNIFNMILPYDIVPKVAMSEWGYGRYGVDMYVKNRNSLSWNKNEKYFYNMVGEKYSVGKAQTTSGNVAIKALTNLVESKETFLSTYEIFIMDMVEGIMCHKSHLSEFVELKYSTNSRYKNAVMFAYQECYFLVENDLTKNLLIKLKVSDDVIWQYVYPICVSAYVNNVQDRLDYILKNNVYLTDLLDIILNCKTIGTVADAHNPEYYISWLFGYDDPKDIFEKAIYKAITVACPVDVSVYDKDDNLVLSVVHHEIETALIPAEVSGDSVKMFIDSDENIEDYRIEIAAYEGGDVTYSISEYEDYTEIRKVNYFDIDVAEGDVLYGNIPTENNCAAEEYDLTLNDEIINRDEVLSGADLGILEINVEVTGDGTAYGMDGVTSGELVVLNAYPMENAEFLGWYDENDNLLSSNEDYTFVATESASLNARFTEQPLKVKINDMPKIENGILSFDADVLSSGQNEADIYTAFYDSNSVLLQIKKQRLTSGETEHNVSYNLDTTEYHSTPISAKIFLWNDMEPLTGLHEFSIINLE